MATVYMNNQQSTINSAFVGGDKIVAIYYNNQLLYNFSGIDTISYLLDSFTGFSGNSRMKDFKVRKVSSFENITKEISDSSKSEYKTYGRYTAWLRARFRPDDPKKYFGFYKFSI